MPTTPASHVSETADGLRRVFRTREGGELGECERESQQDPWTGPHILSELMTPAGEEAPYLTGNGHLITFWSFRDGGPGGKDLYVAYRSALDVPFQAPVEIEGVNTAGDESDTWLSDDQRSLFFTRDGDLYEATR